MSQYIFLRLIVPGGDMMMTGTLGLTGAAKMPYRRDFYLKIFYIIIMQDKLFKNAVESMGREGIGHKIKIQINWHRNKKQSVNE